MEFSKLNGKTITSIEGLELGSDLVLFHCEDGSHLEMRHIQDCCENVSIEDITGDINSIIGVPILSATEDTDDAPDPSYWQNPDPSPSESPYDGTWTFYNIRTVKGYVNIRWLGTSNGYYSESVDCTWY